MKKVLVVINGESGSGKDTFVKMCEEYTKKVANYIPISNIHRSDEAKDILMRMGWNGERTPEIRKLLADLVDFGESTGYNNKQLFDSMKRLGGVVFYHSRDPKNIESIEEHYWFHEDVQVISLFLLRDNNIAKELDRWDMKNYSYNKVIENNSSLFELEIKAREFMKHILKLLEV